MLCPISLWASIWVLFEAIGAGRVVVVGLVVVWAQAGTARVTARALISAAFFNMQCLRIGMIAGAPSPRPSESERNLSKRCSCPVARPPGAGDQRVAAPDQWVAPRASMNSSRARA